MHYSTFKGELVSSLGFGAMRLPCIDGDQGNPDKEETQKLVDLCFSRGINYFDTAWGYHNGKSQIVLSECLKKYPREKYFLANKFPGYDVSNMPKAKEIFEEQLRLCNVDYFDFYLIHNVCELNIDAYLDPKFGIKDYFTEQVKNGRIKHLGFSIHGKLPVLKRFIEMYGDAMEFCQLQINYVDWTFQNAEETAKICTEKGWPIIVMEPLRGGKIAHIDDEELTKLNEGLEPRKPVQWAFDFIQSLPNILTTLTGMSAEDQAEEKIGYYENPRILTPIEKERLLAVGKRMTAKVSYPCTSCRYCTSKCPKELDIPELIDRYNEMLYNNTGMEFHSTMAMMSMPQEKRPSACIGCGKCAAVCPQRIDIPSVMKGFAAALLKNGVS